MSSAFERFAVQRVVDQARAAGVDVPGEVMQVLHVSGPSCYGARKWAELHPDDDRAPCCYGAIQGPEQCTCWVPVYAEQQQPPRPPAAPDALAARPQLCGDCAFRPGSPERADEWSKEALFSLADRGQPFWCHQGMRRPLRWEHPDGRVIDGDPDDWQPPIIDGIPYRADGSPGLLCAGWAARAGRAEGLCPVHDAEGAG